MTHISIVHYKIDVEPRILDINETPVLATHNFG